MLETVPPSELVRVHNSYDVIGDIAIITIPEKSWKYRKTIGHAITRTYKNVTTVFAQTGGVRGSFRLRNLELISGKNKSASVHRESGCLFSIDVKKCYFSPRLQHERMRIAEQVTEGEIAVNMFAGVGCFSIVMFMHSKPSKVYSIDLNPVAVDYMRENIRVNRAYGTVIPALGDAKDIIESHLQHVADRVLMPLPEKSLEYLPYAVLALKRKGGVIHYYDFERASGSEESMVKSRQRLSAALAHLGVSSKIISSHVVRSVGPKYFQVVHDVAALPVFNKLNKRIINI